MKEKSTTKRKSSLRRVPGAARLGQGQNGETKRRAAIVLEVLAGMRTPSEAASVLGLSASYYYLLERKALQGLLNGCQPQPKDSPGPGLERQLARLQKELDKSRQECLRQASLVRATERAMGLSAVAKPTGPSKANSAKEGKKARRRRPTIRANDVGQANGELAAWVDGKLYIHYTGFRWRTSDEVKLKRFNIGVYVHRANQDNTVWYDDVALSTGYIGCGG